MATQRIRLGELLVRAGVIDEMKLKAALAEQHRWGGRLGKILVDMNFVSEEILVKALSKQLGVPRADLSRIDVPDKVMQQVDPSFAETNGLVPVRYDEGRRVLVVATSDPTNVAALDELRFKTGLRIETVLAGDHEVHATIDRYLKTASGLEIDLPHEIELDPDDNRQVIQPNDAYVRAMAASGLQIESHRAPPVPAPPPTPSASPVAAPHPGAISNFQPAVPAPPAVAPPAPTMPPPATMPPAVPVPSAMPGVPPAQGSVLELAARLEGAQRQQQKALRVMVELLIEKGILSRDDYLARIAGPNDPHTR